MDNAVLTPVVDELGRRLVGATLGDAVQIDSRRFVFRFDTPPFPRLALTLHPELSALHLTPRAPTPKETSELAGVLSRALAGATLRSIAKEADERVVEFAFERGDSGQGAFLVLEMLGKASNLLLLDGERRIVRFALSPAGAFRRPVEGATYASPPRRADAGPAGPLPFGSRLLAREAEARARQGEDPDQVRRGLEARCRSGGWAPCVYSPIPLEEIVEAYPLPPAGFFPAPFPLSIGEGLIRRDEDEALGAAALHAEILLRHLLFRDARASLSSVVKAEATRLARLAGTLGKEARAAQGADSLRRKGDLLLASLGSAVKRGGLAEVIDHYDPAAPRISIEIDPAIDLKGNAEAFFRRARKLERAAAVIARRLGETEGRLAALNGLMARIEAAATSEALAAVESEVASAGPARLIRRPRRRELGKKQEFVRVREFRTSDGFTVLIGRTAAENDELTFKIAAPHDFWLHAAGRSGAHVIVRNPGRARELPDPALREAAAAAAWFSRGDRGGEIDVHVAMRKEVRKGRGMSPGMVLLRRYRVVRARPAAPPGAGEGGP